MADTPKRPRAAKKPAAVSLAAKGGVPVGGAAVVEATVAPATMPAGAVGMVETRGLVAAIEAADAMLKTAAVSLCGLEKIGSGLVTVCVRGEVSAVTAAVQQGGNAAAMLGEVVATHVIARPAGEVGGILPE